MALDNRSTDEQADPHAGALRRIKRVEQLSCVYWFEACARVVDAQARTIIRATRGTYDNLPRAIIDIGHRVGCVTKQVDHELLKWHSLPED